MGAQNKRFGTIGDLTLKTVEAKRMQLQTTIDSSKTVESRRQLGQFATPYKLAEEIISYGLKIQDQKEIFFLEPALGTGAFYSALLSECNKRSKIIKRALGIELDKDFFAASQELWGNTGIEIINRDFTEMDCVQNVNFLVTNPPYVRHHCIDQARKNRLSALVKNETGISLSGLAGLYCYFILCAHKWLAPNAVCGWLLPSEFMDVNYGVPIKEYLLNKVHLIRIHRYNPNNCKFDDALVSSCVVWFRNEIVRGDYTVEFSYGGTHENPDTQKIINKNVLIRQKKWTQLAQEIYSDKEDASIPKLGDFFVVKRGLATGDNDFFILSRDKIDELGLEMKFFVPILPSPRYLNCDEIFADENGYPCADRQYFLLNCDLEENEMKKLYPSTWKYIQSGEGTTSEKYLCRNRKKWYCQEKRSATPFLCSYMGRGKKENDAPFRFILNHTKAIVTNSYLMLYPKELLNKIISQFPNTEEAIWKMLSAIASSELEREGRVYGGGLKKIEPKELASVKCTRLAEWIATYRELVRD